MSRCLSALLWAVVVGEGMGSSACTLYVEPDRKQCSSDVECSVHNTAFARSTCVESVCTKPTEWGCLQSVATAPLTSGTVTATLTLVDLVSSAPLPNVTARVCRKLDVDCSQPLLTGLASDPKGILSVAVPSGFDGYVELSPPNAMSGLYFFYPPVATNRQVPAIPLMSVDSLTYLAQLAGAPLIADHSSVFLGAHNCLDESASGVRFSSVDADDATHPFYLVHGIPSTSAKGTDIEGRGGLLNMRIGSVTVSGTLENGQSIATASVFTRPGHVTYAALVPSPN